MSKTIVIKLKKIGNRIDTFSLQDDKGNTLLPSVSREDLLSGISLEVEDDVKVIKVLFGGENCCNKFINIPIGTITKPELAAFKPESKNTSSIWTHLIDNTKYNTFYGCIHPYILEQPIAYEFNDEILQNIKDYTKVYKYLSENRGTSDNNRKMPGFGHIDFKKIIDSLSKIQYSRVITFEPTFVTGSYLNKIKKSLNYLNTL